MTCVSVGCFAFVMVSTLLPQQNNSVDLTRPQAPSKTVEKLPIPGCEKISAGGHR
jgi:hypothetical protein